MYKRRKKKRLKYVRLPDTAYSKYVHIKCNKCREVQKIYTNDKSIYTKEVRENFVCWRCSGSGKDGWYVRLKKAGLI